MWKALATVLGLTTLLGGCSATSLINLATATPSVVVERDLAYAPGDRHSLDVYAPRAGGSHRPVVVFIYGGSWDSGAKSDYAFVGYALARHGYVAIIPDYRVYPQVRWPDFLRDNALAVRWAKDHAVAYAGDPSKLVLMGHSAGAYDAVELGVDGRWLRTVGLDSSRDVLAVVGLSGPYDFLPLRSRELRTIFGPKASRSDTQPINHVDGRAVPMLLITGDRDTTVDPGNSDRLAAKVTAAGGKAVVIHYPSLDHVRTIAAMADPLVWLAPVRRDVFSFVDAQSGFAPDR
jgi:acetyl esterase/lipase